MTDTASLRPVVFAILLALVAEDRHGYGLMQDVNERLRRRAIVGPGTLYRTLKDLREAGWIEHSEGPCDEDVDQRRQYYRLTAEGRRIATGEAERMAELVADARRARLLTEA